MGKNKLKRFKAMESFENVLQPKLEDVLIERHKGERKDHSMKGHWRELFFQNNKPLVLELGCGGGEYSVGMGRKFPEKNFLGIDIKGARIYKGARVALKEGLDNVGFLRTRIDFITSFFEEGEVDEIWITFPDPQPESRRARKRLTSKMFIDRYRHFLKKDGIVHLKTDSTSLYEFTMEEIEEHGYELLLNTSDLYNEIINDLDPDTRDILEIKTFYEELFSSKGHTIKYIKFRI